MGEMVTIASHEGQDFRGYLARPPQAQAPGVIVLQEIFGVNGFIRSVVDDMARAGFVALAPELYWRQGADIQLDSVDEADVKRALALREALDEEVSVADSALATRFLRALPGVSGKCGAMGYCLGGKIAYLLATRGATDAGVAYYGTGIHDALAEAAQLTAPILLHIAADDFMCPPNARQQIITRMDEVRPMVATDIEVCIYHDAGHAFSRPGTPYYAEAAAKLADSRTRAFLKDHLG